MRSTRVFVKPGRTVDYVKKVEQDISSPKTGKKSWKENLHAPWMGQMIMGLR